MVASSQTKSFWDTVPRVKTATFTNMRKPCNVGKSIPVSIDTEVLFRRLLVVSSHRQVKLHVVLQHELAGIAPSLFYDDGSMRKTNKSELAKKLESNCDDITELPSTNASGQTTAYLVDGMSLLQSLNERLFVTFKDCAQLVLKRVISILQSPHQITEVTIVFDRYDVKNSIKDSERLRRAGDEAGNIRTYNVSETQVVPNYRRFLKSPANKAALAAFVSNYIVLNASVVLQHGASITLAGGFEDGKVVKEVQQLSISPLPDLESSQEEADTRLILHAVHLSSFHSRLVVRCDDTDVLVLLLYYYSNGMLGEEVFMEAGHQGKSTNRRRFIPIHTIAKKLGSIICKCLPATHALTGCDTTSALHNIGKRTAYSRLVKHADEVCGLSKFGSTSEIEELLPVAQTYILKLYGARRTENGQPCKTLDELRLALATTTDKPATQLPPTVDAFRQHAMRANFQCMVWCTSHVAKPTLPSPVGNGWIMAKDNFLQVNMFTKDPAPLEVRDLTHLYCTDKNCNSNKCQCVSAGLPCIEQCACSDECSRKTENSPSKPDTESGEETDPE